VDCERFHPRHACAAMRRRLEGGTAASIDIDIDSSSSMDADSTSMMADSGSTAGGIAASPANRSGGGTPAAGPLLLYVGRVSGEKNLELLREVVLQLPGSRLAIVGDGPAMQAMRRHFEGTPTTFLGFLRGRQLATAYASADFFVMPSESETLGNVVGEVSSSLLGCPCFDKLNATMWSVAW
jgi:glycosyltransferase involved in cell wall biosynthesis